MRPENARMVEYLRAHGITARAKYQWAGSLKKTWRLLNLNQSWSLELGRELEALGFLDFNGKSFTLYSGNAGYFSIFARGHLEMISGVTPP